MKKTMEERFKSMEAISKYIRSSEYGEEKRVRIIRDNEVVFDGNLVIFARIETNYAVVHFGKYSSVFQSEFFTEFKDPYQNFTYSNGDLYIEANDRKQQKIKIEILR